MTFQNQTFDFTKMNRAQISATLKEHNIVLSIEEALAIQLQMLQRPPTLTECLLWSIQASEHCSYKSSRKHLKQLPTTGPDVILGPCEDAGIIGIATDHNGTRYGVVVSHESHNHPSQIVPFEGAATGVGGNVRDVCCMGAEVIAIADSLRFGDINSSKTKWIHENVVAGIASYGNAIGVPNLGGDLYYDPSYNDNCLVTVVTLGIVREDQIIHSHAPKDAVNYDLILIGKATDSSGFAGASFASVELEEEKKTQNRGAVQEPNAFLGRHLLKANYALFEMLREKNLLTKVGFKDLGAGGIACASVELAESGGYGACIDVGLVPTSMSDLHPAVILCSETQERYMLVASPAITPLILKHYNETFALPQIAEKAQAKVIGKITSDKNYIVRYRESEIIHAKAQDITRGFCYDRPYQRKITTSHSQLAETTTGTGKTDGLATNATTTSKMTLATNAKITETDLNKILLTCLAHENIASRKPVFETYDKQVQGRIIIETGEADAGVLQPFNSDNYPLEIRNVGIALGVAQNPRYCQIDAYWGAVNAVVEAARNVAAVGAIPIAITDCLCFGNPEKPEQMAELVDAISGIAYACKALQLPVISGNVSLYNESKTGAIAPSPIISCIGKLEDVNCAITPAFKQTDSLIIMIGERKNECSSNVYYNSHVPQPDCIAIANQIAGLSAVTKNQLILSAHDISDGGIAVTLAEMSFKNNIGCNVNIKSGTSLPSAVKLFSESSGFVLEIEPCYLEKITKIFNDHHITFEVIGQTTVAPFLIMQDCINLGIADAAHAWSEGLREKLMDPASLLYSHSMVAGGLLEMS